MATRLSLSGNEAVAYALRQINPDVFPAFPITPSTEIPQYFASYVADGLVDTEFITVESEHSSMSATIAAEAAGARSVTATSSAGLAFMWEVLPIAAADRLPVALTLVTRALSAPININGDHSDSMGARDAGWIQLYAENNQEAYDNMVMAYRIAEHKDVRLPIMICQDGFITSHAVQNIELLSDEEVRKFVGEYEPEHYLLNKDEVVSVGNYSTSSYYIEARRAQAEALCNVSKVARGICKEFGDLTGRYYDLIEEYRMEDAERAIVIIGSAAGTAKDAVDELRDAGEKVGLVKIRFFRPFPGEEIAAALSNVKALAIMDRSEGFNGNGGPLGAETMAALFRAGSKAKAVDYIYGLGGRDVTTKDIKKVYADLAEIVAEDEAGEQTDGKTGEQTNGKTGESLVGQTYRYLGVRE